ncbi:hypothetical protein PAHAL_2G273900 [Panicum hallii]|uniref:Uncharacterized protein n=1 Tax=Panicum hallii TaxID=206008 RepID=A0A2S3GZR9_9POAL|nr:hypothetical protein PAHAL_2G273900 [Panicum hallii]
METRIDGLLELQAAAVAVNYLLPGGQRPVLPLLGSYEQSECPAVSLVAVGTDSATRPRWPFPPPPATPPPCRCSRRAAGVAAVLWKKEAAERDRSIRTAAAATFFPLPPPISIDRLPCWSMNRVRD